jgi:hypothetical protein
MKRRWFAVLGAFILLVWSLVSFTAGLTFDATLLLNDVPHLLAGVLLVAAGTTDTAGGVEWYQFAGLGFVCLGLTMASGLLLALLRASVTTGLLASNAVGAVIGLVLAYTGFDWIRGGKHFDLAAFESGPIFGG